jgi:Ca-activated chloride channel homolog
MMGKCPSHTELPSSRGLHPGGRRGKTNLTSSLIFLLLTSSTFGQNPNSEFKISTDVDLVMLDAGVKTTNGVNVSGLTKENFRIYEDGIQQKITEFSSADMPVTIGLVMDASGSMRSRRPHVITAGLAFIGASNPRDQIFVVNFNDRIRFGLPADIPFTDNPGLLGAALAKDEAQGQTALYDAMAAALNRLEMGSYDRKALIVVSDGGDNRSHTTFNELMRLVEISRATVYTIGIIAVDDADRNPKVLHRIAKVSGGESFLPDNLDEITPICRKIASDIRQRYTLGYIPVHTGEKAAFHKIRIEATAPEHGKLTVRARTSYVLPLPGEGYSRHTEPVR